MHTEYTRIDHPDIMHINPPSDLTLLAEIVNELQVPKRERIEFKYIYFNLNNGTFHQL